MDKREAKVVLQALRPNDLNTSEPLIIQALILVENDPELKAWWEAQQSFDFKVASKLKEVPLPADLRDTILAGRKIKQFTPPPNLSAWLAAAAVVAILCLAGTLRQIYVTTGPLPETEYAAAVLPLLNHDAPSLAMTSADHDKIMAWLKERNAPAGSLTPGLTVLQTIGCQKFAVHGHTVSLVCFSLLGGGVAHLFMVEQDAISDAQENHSPEFNQVQGWSTAAWSDGRMSYLLATQAGPEALKQLL